MPLGQPRKVSASKLVQPLSQTFPNLKIHLFVGIGGGVPRIPPPDNPDEDVHLGDVVIGWAEKPGLLASPSGILSGIWTGIRNRLVHWTNQTAEFWVL